MARYRNRITESNENLTEDEQNDLQSYFGKVYSFYQRIETLIGDSGWDISQIHKESKELTEEGNHIWADHKVRLSIGNSNPIAGMLFSDLIVSLRKIKGHAVNLAESLAHQPITDA